MAETVLTDETAADESAATTADPAAGTALGTGSRPWRWPSWSASCSGTPAAG
ncbi:hypothetical protein [Micromonospora zhanjiangensis]